ncbi:hypothetical protein [Richelia sinica]|uniref:hypothetical protein n=1 Tax=Richelia sinica TaxID=1357545 RepID=UPI0016852DEC|nr:hypothetical protein [Richelia sinica]MBD2667298.1 hypothetical protein [Richelia sinica FACHB-800]
MTKLSIVQLLYLLYVQAYSDEGSVTKGVVKSYLPRDLKDNAEKTYEDLIKQHLIESPKRNRLSITILGKETLIAELRTTKYRFDTVKGQRVINTIIDLLQQMSCNPSDVEDIDYETFVEKFKELYFTERRKQELHGVVAISSREICQNFSKINSISQVLLDEYFNRLKSTGKIFAVIEKNEELIQWAE